MTPPRLAAWLLQRWGGGSHGESLAGDLAEQFQRRRSPAWYWRQVLRAMLVEVIKDLREQKLLALGTAAITYAIMIPLVEATSTLYVWVSHKWVFAWVNHSVVLFTFWIPFDGGLCLMWCAGAALSGWMSALVFRHHRAATVTVSALAQVPLILWQRSAFWAAALHGPVARFPIANRGLSVPIGADAVVTLIGMPLCALLAGLLTARSDGVSQHQGGAA